MLTKILFPKFKDDQEITLRQTIIGVLTTLAIFAIYAATVTFVALVHQNPLDSTPLYDTPAVAWTKPLSFVAMLWCPIQVYRWLNARLKTNERNFRFLIIGNFVCAVLTLLNFRIASLYDLTNLAIALFLLNHTGRKFVYNKYNEPGKPRKRQPPLVDRLMDHFEKMVGDVLKHLKDF